MGGYEIRITKGTLVYENHYFKETKREVAKLIKNMLVGLHEGEAIDIRRKEK